MQGFKTEKIRNPKMKNEGCHNPSQNISDVTNHISYAGPWHYVAVSDRDMTSCLTGTGTGSENFNLPGPGPKKKT